MTTVTHRHQSLPTGDPTGLRRRAEAVVLGFVAAAACGVVAAALVFGLAIVAGTASVPAAQASLAVALVLIAGMTRAGRPVPATSPARV